MSDDRHDISDSVKARRCAALAVMDVTANGAPLERALANTGDYAELDARDRAFARAIAATTFRRMGQIKAVLKPFLRKPPTAFVMAGLQTATAQIVFMGVPAHAAVGETVEMLKSRKPSKGFANFSNAVLRNVVKEGPRLAAGSPPRDNVPGWIRGAWERAYDKIPTRKMCAQLIKDPVLDMSVGGDRDALFDAMVAAELEPKKLGGQTVRLPSIGDVTALPGFETGQWWAQDIAAAQPAQVLAAQFEGVSGKRILDLCAAPGGKTLQLAALGAEVTAVDKSAGRLRRLEDNLTRTKLSANVICADALEWESEAPFDAVLLDAPCSATGTYRRHPDVLHNRTPKSVADLVRLQDRLIPRAASHVALNGVLVYAVCSLQPEEGMPRVTKFLDNAPDFRLIPLSNLTGLDLLPDRFAGGTVRTLPCDLAKHGGMDGFFIAAMRRMG
jgi:16S rRNA (cytosine967-C5)-methyltransferase